MKSQYLEPYKDHVYSKIASGERPVSVGTFLTYQLRGRAKDWSNRYLRSLKKGLEDEGWVKTYSVMGGLAYQPPFYKS